MWRPTQIYSFVSFQIERNLQQQIEEVFLSYVDATWSLTYSLRISLRTSEGLIKIKSANLSINFLNLSNRLTGLKADAYDYFYHSRLGKIKIIIIVKQCGV
jgi:hypothetical protein